MSIEFKDIQLECTEPQCKKKFTWTAGEQQFYFSKSYKPPKRCPDCRKNQKKERRRNRRHLKRFIEDREQPRTEETPQQ